MRNIAEELAGMGAVDCSCLIRPAIYFLLHEGAVVYIGQSRMPIQRIYAHRSSWGKKKADEWRRMGRKAVKAVIFDEVHLLRTTIENLDEVEQEMIQRYRPRYNVHHNRGVAIPPELAALVAELCAPLSQAPPLSMPKLYRRF